MKISLLNNIAVKTNCEN